MILSRLGERPFLSDGRLAQLITLWHHIHHELLAICYVVMDAALLTPLGLGIMQWTRFWPPGLVFAWLCCLMLFAFNLSRLFVMFGVNEDSVPLWTAVVLLATIYFAVRTLVYAPGAFFAPRWLGQFFQDLTTAGGIRWPQAVGIIFFILVAWLRGLRLATRQVDINQMGLRLRLGGLIFAPIIIWFGYQQLVWDVSPYLLLFLLAALTAVALTRAEEIEQSNSGHSAALNPKWLALIVAAAALAIILAALIATIISGESLTSALAWLLPVAIAFQFILMVAILTAVDAILPLWFALERFLNGVVVFLTTTFGIFNVLSKIAAKVEKLNSTDDTEIGGAAPEFDPEALRRFSLDLSVFQQYSNLLLFLLLIAVALVIALTVSSSYRKASFGERGTAVLKPSGKSQGRKLFDDLLSRLGLFTDWRTAASIRRIYRQMCAVADASGFPRLPTETPYEFLQTLAQTWPNNQQETRLITNAFVKVRYGELPESREELEEIRQAWRTLEETPPLENTVEAE